MVKDWFGNEINIGDEVVNVLIYKNEANFRKGIVEEIMDTPRGVNVYVRNADTNRITLKKTTAKDKYVCREILKYNWTHYKYKNEPILFPELFS